MPIGPQLPPSFASSQQDDSSDDDYGPALPPHLAAQRESKQTSDPTPSPPPRVPPGSRRVVGPTLPSQKPNNDEDSDEDVGPMPIASSSAVDETDGVKEFIEREERRRKELEEGGKPKILKREEWMLAPPSASDLLGSLDPKKLRQAKKTFSAATSSSRDTKIDNTLWTETPAERQQRLADEASGKRKRASNAVEVISPEEAAEKRRRLEADAALREKVEEYNTTHRGGTLVEKHAATKKKEEEPGALWDHARDMGLGGRLMSDQQRKQLIAEARGLGDRFGAGKGGSFE